MTTEPIRKKGDIEALKIFLLHHGKIMEYALIVVGINTALRISDLLNLRWRDILMENGNFKIHVFMTEQKTRKMATLFLNESAREALELLFQSEGKSYFECADEYVFKSTQNFHMPMSRFGAYKMIKRTAQKLGLSGNISCHSLRKTFGYHAWKQGVSPALIMNVYNHSSFEVTKRYLGITQDDKDEVYKNINL